MALRQTLSAAPALASRRHAFPGEDEAYTKARKSLLAEEIDLRRKMTRLAEQRHALPPGPLMKDYRFKDANGAELGLVELFGEHDTLVAYFWMYGPERERPCPMCTNWLGAVNGNGNDIKQRIALKIIGRSPVERQKAFAQERGCAMIIVLNKWDIVDGPERKAEIRERIEDRLTYVGYAPVIAISALTGKNVVSYITQLRMEKAMSLLQQHPEMLIGDIAESCCFTDMAYFSRVFRQHYGMTPTQARNGGAK